ncbi:NADH-quinone oxidoreductase subunit C [Mycolicibacterium poriferae]|uniref:NADH-quinone oxidoreductase subunit C n=1 Tax=Mycolicibacterium poriferae TaxID=39694 RepID=UPI0032191E1B
MSWDSGTGELAPDAAPPWLAPLVHRPEAVKHAYRRRVPAEVLAALPSVTSVWRAADWYEREAHDLFGVHFEGHPDLSPLLLYEGFAGYPGRKEYPFNDYQEF